MEDLRPICHKREALIWPIRFVNSFLCPPYHYTAREAIDELGPVSNIDYTLYEPKYITLTSLGMTWCRIIAAIMFAVALFHLESLYRMERGNRFFHRLVVAVHVIAAITYGLMSLGDGFEPVRGLLPGSWDNDYLYYREFPTIRYVDLLVTTPLILILLLRTVAVPAVHIFSVIALVTNCLIMLLGAAIINSEIKWELYYAAAVARIFAGGATIVLGCRHAMKIKDSWITSTFLFCAGMSFLVWTFSPFAWYLCEGRQAISVDEEIIMYSVLDLIAKPIVCTLILQMHRDIDPTTIGMMEYRYDGWTSVTIDTPAEKD